MNLFDYLHLNYRKWKLKKKRQAVVIRGSCNMCGRCCHSISLQIEGRWLKKEKQFLKAIEADPSLSRFEICGKTEEGYLKFSCTCLNKYGTCDDYDNRPALCQKFPAPSIFLLFGELPQGCGFRMSTEADFEQILHDAIENEDNVASGHFPVDK
ncbi:YkgJ family cysteine cluster protein [Maridesulfovibrio sp.]|uniref:YkgJ family cysteine cluster protein n=1 Tax=Maridesulfovibrio sp. TaxID=2795000 RepID=UPI0029CA514E|nr:YkgJ family cysteine cluster protein [Maridesulfovibrio sp.]